MTIIPLDSTDSAINHQKHYVAREFNRYYPDAHEIIVTHEHDGEVIHVRVADRDPSLVLRDFTFECGSDDDYYEFINDNTGAIITIPLEVSSED